MTENDQLLVYLYYGAILYSYKMIEEKIKKEIKKLENDLAWESFDPSIKKRIKKLELTSYAEESQQLLDTEQENNLNMF